MLPTGYFNQTFRLLKSQIGHYLGLEAKNNKSKTTLLFQILKILEIKAPLFFHFWPLSQDIDDFCLWLKSSVRKKTVP